jgi:hypothetical protein
MPDHALCTGISTYNNKAQNPNGCLNDAKASSTLLKTRHNIRGD